MRSAGKSNLTSICVREPCLCTQLSMTAPSGELEGDMSNEGIGYHLDLMVDGLGTGMVYVRSKDVPGLHLVGENFVAMKPMIEKAIKRLFLDNRGQKVRVVFLAEVAQFPKKHSRKIKELPSKVAVFPVSKAA